MLLTEGSAEKQTVRQLRRRGRVSRPEDYISVVWIVLQFQVWIINVGLISDFLQKNVQDWIKVFTQNGLVSLILL